MHFRPSDGPLQDRPALACALLSIAVVVVGVSSRCRADGVSLFADKYSVVEAGQTFSVIDLYVDLPSLAYQVNFVGGNVSLAGAMNWFHSDAAGSCPDGGTWLPVGSITNPLSDSFVTIGQPSAGQANATILNPNFVNAPACSSFLGTSAAWINSLPQNFQGFAHDITLHDGAMLSSATMVGRFSVMGLPSNASLDLGAFLVSYQAGFGPPPQFGTFETASFAYVPGPGLPSMLVFILLDRRRRTVDH